MKKILQIILLSTVMLSGPIQAAQYTIDKVKTHSASFYKRLYSFQKKYSDTVKVIKKVNYDFEGDTINRTFLFVALKKREGDRLVNNPVVSSDAFKKDYFNMLGFSTISVPLERYVDFFRLRFKDKYYKVYSYASENNVRLNESRLEVSIVLSRQEFFNLDTYITNIMTDKASVLGDRAGHDGAWNMDLGFQLDDNKPQDGQKHNCTSWLILAPIGNKIRNSEAKVSLYQIMNMKSAWDESNYPYVMINPSWLGNYLLGSTQVRRVRLSSAFLRMSLDQINKKYNPKLDGETLKWKWDDMN